MKPTLLVLAAGMGSRYGGLKQMDKLGPAGETIIDYSIYDALSVGFEKIVFVIRESIKDDFKKILGDKYANKAAVHYVYQELDKLPKGYNVPQGRVRPWGTAHAVMMAESVIQEPFALINGDDFYGRNSFKIIYDFLSKTPKDTLAACLIAYELKKTLSEHGHVSRGICTLDKQDFLSNITERTKIYKGENNTAYYIENDTKFQLTGNEKVSMNLMGFTPNVFEIIRQEFENFLKTKGTQMKSEFYIPFILDKVREKGVKVPILSTNESWFGVTYPEDKQKVVEKLGALIQKGIYPPCLWENDV